nr:immunoglobulin heavy chain junction region [Mus musculus]NSM04140.1 immunoglobulin heavy chain junction region [Mus musculus]NSM04346.1 immunoglobulin heavy chain junction region [Mus musculus]NSM05062.1 immunoglobulin heavy chain junction region [Mus musculus]NSM05869.1 immunoglobulin heavy chain junction region [Mus musculus]
CASPISYEGFDYW